MLTFTWMTQSQTSGSETHFSPHYSRSASESSDCPRESVSDVCCRELIPSVQCRLFRTAFKKDSHEAIRRRFHMLRVSLNHDTKRLPGFAHAILPLLLSKVSHAAPLHRCTAAGQNSSSVADICGSEDTKYTFFSLISGDSFHGCKSQRCTVIPDYKSGKGQLSGSTNWILLTTFRTSS